MQLIKRKFKGLLAVGFLLLASPVFAQVSSDVEGIALAATDPRIIVAKVIRAALGLLGIVVLSLIIYGGFIWMTAAGNEERIEKAKKILTSSIIGLVIILTSFAITQFVLSRFLAATRAPGQYEIAIYQGGGGGLTGSAFIVQSIQPQGTLDSKKIIVKIAFSDVVDPDSLISETIETITVSRTNGDEVEGTLAVGPIEVGGTTLNFSERIVTFIPDTPCEEEPDYFCFEENTEFVIDVAPGGVKRLLDSTGVSCGFGTATPCQASFTTGTIVDLTPPQVSLRSSPRSVSIDGFVTLQSYVTDNSGVALTEFYHQQTCPEQSAEPAVFNTDGPEGPAPKFVNLSAQWFPEDEQVLAPSEHEFFAKAYDLDSGQSESSRVDAVVRPAHCSNGIWDEELGETDVDCGGEATACGGSACGSCKNGPCDKDLDCADAMICKEDTKTCDDGPPEISGITPGDGKVGTLVSIWGLNFGSNPGTVYFTGADDGEVQALPPEQCQGISPWQDQLVMVSVPEGALDGPIRLVTAGDRSDSSNDEYGLVVPVHAVFSPRPEGVPNDGSYDVNDLTRPALCSATSPPDDLSAGGWSTAVNLAGAQFGDQCVDDVCGGVSFGGIPGPDPANWTDTGAQTAVPGIDYGEVRIQVVNVEGTASNSLPYDVVSPDAGTVPVLDSISCAPQNAAEAGPGTGCTLSGRNFGDTPGLVQFVAPGGQVVEADTSVPSQCEESWWSSTSITVKVPAVHDLDDVDNDDNDTELLTSALAGGDYQVFVRRYDVVDSNKVDFTMTTDTGPYLACVVPSAGPAFTNVTFYGERLGSSAAQGRGMLFTHQDSVPTSAQANDWAPTIATLVNIGGAQGDSCPSSGWSGDKICAQVPGEAKTGDVIAENDLDDMTQQSNPVEFQVGNCNEADSGIDCGTLTCCANGTCNTECSDGATPEGAYGWTFSTAAAPVVPKMRTFCDADSANPSEPPTPAPWNRQMGNDVCVNAIVSVGFSTRIANDAASLISEGFEVDKCTGAENLLTERNATFETTDGDSVWAPVASTHLTAAVVGNTGYESNSALLLTKNDNDVGSGWNGLNYEHWFGYHAPIISNTNGTTYTASALMRLAPESTVQNKKAGILIQRDGSQGVGNTCGGVFPGNACDSDGDCTGEDVEECLPTPGLWMKSSHEIELSTDEWRQVTTIITFDRNGPNSGASGYVRLFLEGDRHDEGEDPADVQGDFAVYVDNIQITADDCLEAESVSLDAQGSILEIVQTSIDPETGLQREGFRFTPAAVWDTDTWYRVTLLNGIRGEGDFGQPMEIMEDPTPCGYANAADCFRFKTRANEDPCVVGAIAVSPNPWTAKSRNESINYSALPLAAGDHCVPLRQNADDYTWSWASNDTSKAQVEFALSNIGQACHSDNDCVVGSCSSAKFCTGMPWTTSATALQETAINAQDDPVPVQIQASVDQAAVDEDVMGWADLFIQFVKPKIVRWWPSCGTACTNADIGGQFNVDMQATTFIAANIELWQMECGNNTVDTGEDCDDGNNVSGDGCSDQCEHEGADFNFQCGDETIDFGEDCDDGNLTADDGCSAICLNEGVTGDACGNASLERNQTTGVGEECDDGNRTDGDGCSSVCLHEGTNSDVAICGNGRLEIGEECERIGVDVQGNPLFDDQVCNTSTCLRKGQNAPLCGNGIVDPGEECDRTFSGAWPPNNLCGTPLDAGGTSTQCRWSGTQKPSTQRGAGCGNGTIDLGEDCDDGNVRPNDGCSVICENEGSQAITIPACGNGTTEQGAGEDCDDGNNVSGDGCSDICLNEGTIAVECGNGILEQIAEDCDWSLIAQSTTFTDAQAKALCSPTLCINLGNTETCGNGAVQTGEDCDDGLHCSDSTPCESNSDCTGIGDGLCIARSGDGCSDRCVNEGTQASRVSITLGYDSDSGERTFDLNAGILSSNTSYRVLVRGQGLLSAVGKALHGLNFAYTGWGDDNQLPPTEFIAGEEANTFSWTFTTAENTCAVERVELNPREAELYVIGSRQDYSSAAYGPPDSCTPQGQRLNPFMYDWDWNTSDDPTNVVGRIVSDPGIDVIPGCGNGRVDPGEDCDDGNTVTEDGCYGPDAAEPCTFEGSGFLYACGNGVIDPGEECEWPILCNDRCLLTGTPACPTADGFCCGNNVRDFLAEGTGDDEDIFVEDCDDGNLIAGDGCSPQCLNEEKTLLSGTPPPAECDNDVIEYGEECEDGNSTAGDGCSDRCLIEGSSNHGTIAEAGPSVGQTLPQAPARIDPYQQAEARGIEKFCRSTTGTFTNTSCTSTADCDTSAGVEQVCYPPNPWATIQILAAAQGKQGTANLTVYCSARTDRDCPVPEDPVGSGSGDGNIGRGDDGCCYHRPAVQQRSPAGTDVCPNAMFRAVFNDLLDPDSLPGNVRLMLGSDEVEDITLGIILQTTTLAQEGIDLSDNDPVSALVLRPSRILDSGTEYKIQLQGDSDINDDATTGIKSLAGAGMNGLYDNWELETATAPCRLDKVVLEISPNDTNFSKIGEFRNIQARAMSPQGDEIQSVTGYAWDWSWGSEDSEIASVSNVSIKQCGGVEDGAICTIDEDCEEDVDCIDTLVIDNQTVTAGSKNGTASVNATATIVDDTVFDPSTEDMSKVGTKAFTTFICDNPWPIDPSTGNFIPFIDVGSDDDRNNPVITPAGSSAMNFSTYYCRDDQTLLPELNYPGAVLLGGEDPNRLKEFLLTASTFASTGQVERLRGNNLEDPVGDVETNVLAGSASAQSNADFVYLFDFPNDGDYELEVETSNFSDDLSNLASILDEQDIPAELRAILAEDDNEHFKLSGSWYHELEVYVDGVYQGTIINRASGPSIHPRGKVILQAMAKGEHAVRLRWINDNRLPTRDISGYQPGSIWDSNLRIYSLTLRQGRAQDQAIGIRIMKNPDRVSPLTWYNQMNFDGDPVPYPDKVDGYEAIQEGQTIYAAAINAVGADDKTVYGNIYLVSLSEGAGVPLQTIYDQIIKNMSFNVNLDNLKTCAVDFCSNDSSRAFFDDAACGQRIQKTCSTDLSCIGNGQISCRADKDKLRRDLVRMDHLSTIQQALNSPYPTLEAGSYIRGISTSRWPSWNATLGAALGSPLPQDPINLFADGCSIVESEAGTYDPTTCWNEMSQTYRCPLGSHIYQYESRGGVGYRLSAEFELIEKDLDGDLAVDWDVGGWAPSPDLPEIVSTHGVCTWQAPGDIQWSNAEARCGNRVIEGDEICEPGSTEQATVTFDPPETRCTGNPNIACSDADPCPDGTGVCEALTSCVAVRRCLDNCTNWRNWAGGTSPSDAPVAADCAAGGTFCGNGVIEGDETCDDGLLNGDYGKCNNDCDGFSSRCGDEVIDGPPPAGPEICDDGPDNGGTYNEDDEDRGWCKFDCTGYGAHCGDGRVQEADEQCDGGGLDTTFKRCISGGALTDTACDSIDDCSGIGDGCASCPDTAEGYAQFWERPCTGECAWGSWGECVPAERCGNNRVEDGAGEECEDGNSNNEDGCTNECKWARCGDGVIRTDVDTEECDEGSRNGMLCDPRYGGTCTYCDNQCNIGTLSGGFCGDRTAQPAREHCDGTAGFVNADGHLTWMCKGGATNERFWTFASELDLNGWSGLTPLMRWPGGYNSVAAMRFSASATTEIFFGITLDRIFTSNSSYIISMQVNTMDTAVYEKAVEVILVPTDIPYDPAMAHRIEIDSDPSSWQTVEVQADFPTMAEPTAGRLVVRVFESMLPDAEWAPASSSPFSILVDNIHVYPLPGLPNLSCSDANCRRSCAAGIACENTLADGDYDGDFIADRCDNDNDNDGDPNVYDCADDDPTRYRDAVISCSSRDDKNCNSIPDEDECVDVVINVVDDGASDDTFCIYMDDQLVDYAYGSLGREVNIAELPPGPHALKILSHHSDRDRTGVGTYAIDFSSNITVLNPPGDLHTSFNRPSTATYDAATRSGEGDLRRAAQANDAGIGRCLRGPRHGLLGCHTIDDCLGGQCIPLPAEEVCTGDNGTSYAGMNNAGSVTYMIEVEGAPGGGAPGGGAPGGGAGDVPCMEDSDCPADRPTCDLTTLTCTYVGP